MIAAESNQEFGIKDLDGNVTPYRSEEFARATLQRFRGWPTTKHHRLVIRDVQVTDWAPAREQH